jgi:transposase-like protein
MNMLDKLPQSMHGKAKQALHDIYSAESRQAAERSFDRFVALYQAKFPKAVECLSKDRESLLTF